MKIFYLFISFIFLSYSVSFGEVIFQDNFDSQSDWTRVQPTNSDDVCYSNCSGIPTGWTSYRNGFSYCTNGPGNNNFYIQNTNARNNSGKAITFWDESCTNMFEDSDGMIAKEFDSDHSEIYVRFNIKFQPDYEVMDAADAAAAGHSDSAQHKLWHVQHYCKDGGSPYAFFGARDRCNYPLSVGGFSRWTGSNNIQIYNLFSCEESSCNTGTPEFTATLGSTDYVTIGSITELKQSGNLFDGNYHSIEMHYKMNTNSGATFYADGIWEIWIDGVLIHSRTDVPWSNNGSEQSPRRGWNFIALGGNNNNRWTADCSGTSCEQWYAIDDVVIATEYIGPLPSGPPSPRFE